jgi:two-component system sensor histidine kinase AlgZ
MTLYCKPNLTDLAMLLKYKKTPATAQEDIGFLPDFSNPRVISIALIAAVIMAIMFSLAATASGGDVWKVLPLLILFMIGLTLSNIIVLQTSRNFLSALTPKALAAFCISSSLLITYTISLFALNNSDMRWIDPHESMFWNFFLIRNCLISTILSAVILRYFYVQHQWKSNIQTQARSRLQALQARIRPHFLFNSMNTIASLTVSDPHKAEKAVLDLADLFRASLAQQDKIPLNDELNFIRGYINIEELRLGERLNVVFNIQENLSLKTLVPALIIQPLVENAIYHGIEPFTAGGTIKIELTSDSNGLIVHITNPIPHERDPKRSGNKMAQDNIRQRLQLAYGGQAKMEIYASGQDYTASFNIPFDAK